MSSDSGAPIGQQRFKDVIVTLPGWGVVLIAILCFCSLVLAVGLALLSSSDDIRGYAVQLLVVLVPLGSAVIAAIAIRRTSTQQIDDLVTGFLERTLLERLQIQCDHVAADGSLRYPFRAVRLSRRCRRTSYVTYELQWAATAGQPPPPPVEVGFKCNVFNFELFTTLEVPAETEGIDSGALRHANLILNSATLGQYLNHPVLRHFMGVLQGSANEGYEVHVGFRPAIGQSAGWTMSLSLRQKLRENFLTSPFLKRYFAEDAAIAIGVLYSEWLALAGTRQFDGVHGATAAHA